MVSWTCQTHNRDIISILLTSSSWIILQVSNPSFAPLICGLYDSHLGHKLKGKSLVHYLQYGLWTGLVIGIYYVWYHEQARRLKYWVVIGYEWARWAYLACPGQPLPICCLFLVKQFLLSVCFSSSFRNSCAQQLLKIMTLNWYRRSCLLLDILWTGESFTCQ